MKNKKNAPTQPPPTRAFTKEKDPRPPQPGEQSKIAPNVDKEGSIEKEGNVEPQQG